MATAKDGGESHRLRREITTPVVSGVILLVLTLVVTWAFNKITAPAPTPVAEPSVAPESPAPRPFVRLAASDPRIENFDRHLNAMGFWVYTFPLTFRVTNSGNVAATACTIVVSGLKGAEGLSPQPDVPAGHGAIFKFTVALEQGVIDWKPATTGQAHASCAEASSADVTFSVKVP
jgi:hypothetical protein